MVNDVDEMSLTKIVNLGSSSIESDEKHLLNSIEDVNSFKIPSVFLKDGLLLLKVSHKSRKRVKLKVEPSNFKFVYELPKGKIYEFLVDDIKGLFWGDSALNFREEFGISKEFDRQWLSIAFFNQSKNKLKTLHLICDTTYDFRRVRTMFTGFKKLKDDIAQNFFLNLSDLHDSTRSMVAEKAERGYDVGRDSLSLLDVVKFTKRMNINLSERRIRVLFQQAKIQSGSSDTLLFDEFKTFVTLLNKREDLEHIWTHLVYGNPSMDFLQFKVFMSHHQNENSSEALLRKWFIKFDSNLKGYWQRLDFNSFLLSRFCNPVRDPGEKEGYFSRPLNEYYILSSHNTYLLGRQVMGESSVEGYIKALQRGCRCLEIDIWNNSNDKDLEPVVNHGRTFTNGISLRNVVKTIKAYAFQVTSYPLILSIENHCSPESQNVALEIFRVVFGDLLVRKPLSDDRRLPSPEDLRYRILLKVKKTDGPLGKVDETSASLSTGTSTATATLLSDSTESGSLGLKMKLSKKSSTKSVIKPLSEMGVYVQGVRFRNFSLPESKVFNHCFSLSEKSINTMLRDDNKCASLDKHNRNYLMRIYPSKIRLKSTNFNPITYWKHGVQMVATNWQTYDIGQQINEAMFNAPLGEGFVLKSEILRAPYSREKKVVSRTTTSKSVEITVISAHQLPKPIEWLGDINPFISLEILGADAVRWCPDKPVTKIVAGNGFNPVWNEKFTVNFDGPSELVFLKVTVASSSSVEVVSDQREVGLVIQNICDLKNGFRYFMLKDMCGEQLLYSYIFLYISLERAA